VLGADTNVLVRFLADDDDTQTPMAARLFSDTKNQPIFLSMMVLGETFTVLTRVKRFPPSHVIDAFRDLTRSGAFEIEDLSMLQSALDDAERAGCGLTDAIISRQNLVLGCTTTATFDHRATRLAGMVAVEDHLRD
jgi:predicted nucleic-acid-binding protein